MIDGLMSLEVCAVSGLTIRPGDEVMVVLLSKRVDDIYADVDGVWRVAITPYYGKYSADGVVTDMHGETMALQFEKLRGRLYKFGSGIDTSTYCSVDETNVNEHTIFELSKIGRLGVEGYLELEHYELNDLERSDQLTESQVYEHARLINRLKSFDPFCPVVPVVVHMEMLNRVIEHWTVSGVSYREISGNTYLRQKLLSESTFDRVDFLGNYVPVCLEYEDSLKLLYLSHFMQQACRPWAPTCVGTASSSGQKFLHEQALAILNNRGKHDN